MSRPPSQAHILVVEDEADMRTHLQTVLEAEGYRVSLAQSGEEGIARLETELSDLVLCDMAMPGKTGFDVLDFVKSHSPEVPLVMLTAYGTIGLAVDAMKRGASDFLQKPCKNEEIRATMRRVLAARTLAASERARPVHEPAGADAVVSRSRQMKQVIELVRILAQTTVTVLIQGESGVGKELVARAIHTSGLRRAAPFVAIDCGAMTETILESELFGHVKGAFTGAFASKRGLFEEANHGTVLLDEIGNTSLVFQGKLLRVLQQGEVKPVGSNHFVLVDVRIIAATNQDLKEQVKKGLFRDDLYYRLAVVPVMIPPLRERPEDIPLLAEQFIKKVAVKHGIPTKRISLEAMDALDRYAWPGNVRELENAIERAALLEQGNEIRLESLPGEIRPGHPHSLRHGDGELPLKPAARAAMIEIEKDRILTALQLSQWNKAQAARILNISRVTLYQKIRQYGLDEPLSHPSAS